jgi:GGDEF domain-containing protein/PAS domain-containing protein
VTAACRPPAGSVAPPVRSLRAQVRRLRHRVAARLGLGEAHLAGILDLFDSDVTRREEADARLVEASDRFSRLLDVVGEHVYLAQALPDGRIKELFQGPGADRLLGGADPDAEMESWEAALHPSDRAAYAAFNRALAAGEDADVEYRLIGADGITRWVHDRAATRRRPDGAVEISGIVSDVTERRRMRAELAETHAALSRVVDAMDDHLYTLRVERDGGYSTVYRGPHREALAGGLLPGGAQDDRIWESLVHADDRRLWRSTVARLAHGQPIELEYRVIGLDGVERIVLDRLRPRREADGTLFYDGATRDISERRRLEDELRSARSAAELRARTDELTGAFNRRHFAEIVAEALAGEPHGCGLLLLDADHFKQVNDAHGHVVGDAVLVELARRLSADLGPDDCLARWGGEEFAVLLRGVSSDAELDRRGARRCRARHARRPRRSGRPLPVRRQARRPQPRVAGARRDRS